MLGQFGAAIPPLLGIRHVSTFNNTQRVAAISASGLPGVALVHDWLAASLQPYNVFVYCYAPACLLDPISRGRIAQGVDFLKR